MTRVVVAAPSPPVELEQLARGYSPWTEGDGVVAVSFALLELIADLTGSAREQESTAQDRHGRVPSAENPLVRSALDGELVLQQVAARFRSAAIRAAGSRPFRLLAPWPGTHRWAVGLSHDLDIVAAWPLFTGFRLTELARHREFKRATRAILSATVSLPFNPVTRGVKVLLDVEARAGVRSTWFILCGTPTAATFMAGDLTYRPESRRTADILRRIGAAGHEIALHGSFETSRRPAAFGEQRQRLAALARSPAAGVRQHFVRLRPGATHLEMARAGFAYDASMGFPDRNGFRLGVSDVVPAWDAKRRVPLELDLVPFAWMDRALSKYSAVEDPEIWIAEGLRLAERCRAEEGLWAAIWHPNLVPALGFPGAPQAFEALVEGLGRSQPWFATHRELVAWRQSRRAAVAVAIDGQGRVTARTSGVGTYVPRLESVSGEPLEAVEMTA